MKHPLPIVALLVSAAAVASDPAAVPSTPGEPPAAGTTVEERIEVRLTTIPIVAVDRNGRPITDLGLDEIVVRVDGEPQRVAGLTARATVSEPRTPRGEVVLDAPGGDPVSGGVPATVPEHLVLFIDVQNDDPLGRSAAFEALGAYVAGLPPSTVLAVLSFDGGLRVETSFTTNRESWTAAIGNAFSRTPRARLTFRSRIETLVREIEDCAVDGGQFSQVVLDERCMRDVVRAYSEEHRPSVEAYLESLRDAVTLASGVDGAPAAILAVSHGVSVDPANEIFAAARAVVGPSPQLSALQLYQGFGDRRRLLKVRLIELAQQEGVALHFLDRTRPPAAEGGARSGFRLQPGARPVAEAYAAAQSDVEELREQTGGLFVKSTDVTAGLDQIEAARRGTYLLDYYAAPDGGRRGGDRSLKIDCRRRRCRILHRERHHDPQPDFSLAGRIVIGRRSPATRADSAARYPLTIQVSPESIGYRVLGDEAQAEFTLHVTVDDASGERVTETFHVLSHAYDRETWDSGTRAPMTLTGWMELPAGTYAVSAFLKNSETGRRGRLTTAVEVRGDTPAG